MELIRRTVLNALHGAYVVTLNGLQAFLTSSNQLGNISDPPRNRTPRRKVSNRFGGTELKHNLNIKEIAISQNIYDLNTAPKHFTLQAALLREPKQGQLYRPAWFQWQASAFASTTATATGSVRSSSCHLVMQCHREKHSSLLNLI